MLWHKLKPINSAARGSIAEIHDESFIDIWWPKPLGNEDKFCIKNKEQSKQAQRLLNPKSDKKLMERGLKSN